MLIDEEVKDIEPCLAEQVNYPNIKQSMGLGLYFLLFSVVTAIPLIIIKTTDHPDKSTSSLITLLSYSAAILGVIGVGLKKIKQFEGISYKIKLNKVALIPIVVGVVMVLTMPVLTAPINILWPMSDKWKKIFAELSDPNLFTIIMGIVAAPILEEILFRGIILNGLLKNYSPQKAIIVSAAIFGLVHLNPWQAIPAFLGGLLMGWMYWKTNSIIPGMLIHFANNLFSILLSSAFKNTDSLNQLVSTPVYIALFVICAAIAIGGWMFLEKYFEYNPTLGDEEAALGKV
ncbi:CPBP family intramembrane glutamic endopeptidase [Mucilaginibacter paludis]|uniref:Abortive infection protein n=1 Tax=Mucilaginibacter paludis DSM 18603 TaxID=714943 RepID=H1Y3A6_9SPHI|nr:type II CAAX endopeptidase family protein [Mucilaginibacter paludis]EHQ29261.1 Abortive infection protein [Mucilaginibacter paludis DSM 18603]